MALLAFATGGAPVWLPRGPVGVDRGTVARALLLLFSVGGILVTLAVLIRHHRAPRDAGSNPPLRRALLRAAPGTVVTLVLVGLWGIANGHLGGRVEVPVQVTPDTPGREGEGLRFRGNWSPAVRDGPGTGGFVGDARPAPQLPPLSVLLGLAAVAAALAAGVWWWAGRGEREGPGGETEVLPRDDAPDAEATRAAVLHTIDEMLADPDPNTAVIGAYARLLEGLAACGATRRPHEGPTEHLRRVLLTLRVRAAPLHRLVGLFEAARFSAHELEDAHRTRALDALRAVAADLEPVAGPSGEEPAERPVP